MHKQYNSVSELIREVLEYKTIDLIPYVLGIEQRLLDALVDDAKGLYLPNSLEPIFYFGHEYILSKDGIQKITVNINDILKDIVGDEPLPPGHIYNAQGGLMFRRDVYNRFKFYLMQTTVVQSKGCEAAIAVVISHLNKLCPYTNIAERHYKLPLMVKEGHEHLLENSNYETAFDDLILDVMNFTKDSEWNIYHYRVSGTTLILEKGLDYRIYDWHVNQLKKTDGYDHDFGGVLDGYATTPIGSSTT